MFEWEWWDGEPQERGVQFVEIGTNLGSVLLSAGHNDYEVWGRIEVDPDTAEMIAIQLLEASKTARDRYV